MALPKYGSPICLRITVEDTAAIGRCEAIGRLLIEYEKSLGWLPGQIPMFDLHSTAHDQAECSGDHSVRVDSEAVACRCTGP